MAEDTQATPNDEAEVSMTVVSPAWPRDVDGFTSGLRREIVRTVGRIKGNDAKMETFMEHLRTGAKWAHDRMEVQKRIRESDLAMHKQREDTEQLQRDANAGGEHETDDAKFAAQRAAGIGGATS